MGFILEGEFLLEGCLYATDTFKLAWGFRNILACFL